MELSFVDIRTALDSETFQPEVFAGQPAGLGKFGQATGAVPMEV